MKLNFYELATTKNSDSCVCVFLLSNVKVPAKVLTKLDASYLLTTLITNEDNFPDCKLGYGVSMLYKFVIKPAGSTRFFDRWNPIEDLVKDANSLLDISQNQYNGMVACFELKKSLQNVKLYGNEDDQNFIKEFLGKAIKTQKKYLTIIGSVGWALKYREYLPQAELSELPKHYLFWGRG